jgi:hypothetical protein
MIVVVTDGSRTGLRAVEWAAREAADRAVGLHVVHAVSAGGGAGAVLGRARAAALAAEPRILVTTATVPGDPRPALIEAGREAELLVMGDHRLADYGLGTFHEPPVNSAGLSVPPCVLCDVVVVRPDRVVRLPPAKWLFDPKEAERDDLESDDLGLCGLLGAVVELNSRPGHPLPDARA